MQSSELDRMTAEFFARGGKVKKITKSRSGTLTPRQIRDLVESNSRLEKPVFDVRLRGPRLHPVERRRQEDRWESDGMYRTYDGPNKDEMPHEKRDNRRR